jgi:hypothetical protein
MQSYMGREKQGSSEVLAQLQQKWTRETELQHSNIVPLIQEPSVQLQSEGM